jgi:hypothetical protein
MANKKAKTRGSTTATLPKNGKQKKSGKSKRRRPLDIEKVRERMKTHKPPQSWYDEDHTGLY